MGYDLFISYASQDLEYAKVLHPRLTDAGFSVWFDKARLNPGCDWHKEIEAGCEAARVILPILTPRWKQSEWTRYETYGHDLVIPLVFEGEFLVKDARGGVDEKASVSTPPLRRLQAEVIDFRRMDDHDWKRLLESIDQALKRPRPDKTQRIASIRHRHNPYFVGRERLLDELHEKLFVSPTAALTQGRIEVLYELGGVGKTTLARAYVEKFWRLYPWMLWVDCRLGLASEFAGLFQTLLPDIPSAGVSPADKAARVREELNRPDGPRRLLVIDNADDEESVLAWLPRAGNCHTIITSRFSAWSPGIETIRVWVLEPEPARLLLVRRAGRDWETMSLDERSACDELAVKLGFFPLALEQAAAYVNAQRDPQFGFRLYLRVAAESEKELLAARSSRGSTDYPDSVFLTWRTTIDKLLPEARAMLRLAAFFAPAPIPFSIFLQNRPIVQERAARFNPGQAPAADNPSEVQVRAWRQALLDYCMVQPEPDSGISVHGLVQAVERHSIDAADHAGWIDSALQAFVACAPSGSQLFAHWPIWKSLLPHGQALWEWSQRSAREVDRASLAMGMAGYEQSQGDYAAAEPLYVRALEARERVLGRENPDTLNSLNNLALLLQAKGDYAAAEPLYVRALEACERVLGRENPDTLNSVNNLALLLKAKGDYAAAEPLLVRALEAYERVLGRENPDTLNSVNNLAVLLYAKGDYAAAEPLLVRALEARERVLGRENPDTLTSLNNLALLLQAKGDYAAAEPLYVRALEARERVLGRENPDTLTSVNNLAVLLQNKGDYAAAEPLLVRALEAYERVLGRENPDTLTSVNNLAELFRKTGRIEEAAKLRQGGHS